MFIRQLRILTDSRSLMSSSNCLFCSFIFIIMFNTDCRGWSVRSNWWYMFLQNLYDKEVFKQTPFDGIVSSGALSTAEWEQLTRPVLFGALETAERSLHTATMRQKHQLLSSDQHTLYTGSQISLFINIHCLFIKTKKTV